MAGKAEYRSAIRSRKLIRQAFAELMKEKRFDKITVTDIITLADINRGTFYAHYRDTRDVIEQIENEIIGKLYEVLGELRYKDFFQNPLPLLQKISRSLEEDLELYRILINSYGSEQFMTKLRVIFIEYMKTNSDIQEHIKNSPEFLIHTHFFAGGIANLYQIWLKGEINQSLNEITQEVSKIIVKSSPMLLDKK